MHVGGSKKYSKKTKAKRKNAIPTASKKQKQTPRDELVDDPNYDKEPQEEEGEQIDEQVEDICPSTYGESIYEDIDQ